MPPLSSWSFAIRASGRMCRSEDVREMLMQHILTKDIFLNGCSGRTQFHRENNVAGQLDRSGAEHSSRAVSRRRQAIDSTADLLRGNQCSGRRTRSRTMRRNRAS